MIAMQEHWGKGKLLPDAGRRKESCSLHSKMYAKN